MASEHNISQKKNMAKLLGGYSYQLRLFCIGLVP